MHPDIPGAWSAAEFALSSPRVAQPEEARAYAASSLLPGRPLAEAVDDLVHRIHADFAYDSTATTVTSTVDEVLRTRAGVCQDFAHLALSCLRSHGVAARYVSGYLATQPPPARNASSEPTRRTPGSPSGCPRRASGSPSTPRTTSASQIDT